MRVRDHDTVGEGEFCSRCGLAAAVHVRPVIEHAAFPRIMENGRPARICGYETEGIPCNRRIQLNGAYWSHSRR